VDRARPTVQPHGAVEGPRELGRRLKQMAATRRRPRLYQTHRIRTSVMISYGSWIIFVASLTLMCVSRNRLRSADI
jgi:hypothetical protein